MTKEKSAHSIMSVVRDVALIFGIISGLIGFGPQIIESVNKLVDAKRQFTLYKAYVDYGKELFDNGLYSESIESFAK